MKSKTSFFNAGLFKNILKRTWPLWFAYFLIWFIALPLTTLIESGNYHGVLPSYLSAYKVLTVCTFSGIIMAILAATVVFSFMYNSRSTGLIASLPLKRETVFGSAYLAGLLPVIAANLLVAVLNILFSLSFIKDPELTVTLPILFKANGILFAASSLNYIIFYGIAVIIAMMTGSIVALPVLYAIFNFLFVGMEWVVHTIMGEFVFGFEAGACSFVLMFTSPFLFIFNTQPNMYAAFFGANGDVTFPDLVPMSYYFEILLIYTVISVILTVIALLMYRKRRMESAGDFIAVPALRPVFRFGISICASLCFGLFIYTMFSDVSSFPLITLIIGLIIGAFLGYFVTRMLMRKSLHVFEGRWTEFIVLCVLCVAFALGCRFDVFGVASRLPDASEVKEVYCEYSFRIGERDSIEKILELNRSIIDARAEIEGSVTDNDEYYEFVYLRYVLNDGSTVIRSYYMPENSYSREYRALLNSPEVLREHYSAEIPVAEQNIVSANIWYNSGEIYESTDLTPAQAVEFYNAFMRDIDDGNVNMEDAYLSLGIDARIELSSGDPSMPYGEEEYEISFSICPGHTNSLKWLSDNLGIDPTPIFGE